MMRPSLPVMMATELPVRDMVLPLVEDLLHLLPLIIQVDKVAQVKENMQGVAQVKGDNLAMEGNNRQLDGHMLTIMAILILMKHFSRVNSICHPYLLMSPAVMDPMSMGMLILSLHPPTCPTMGNQQVQHQH